MPYKTADEFRAAIRAGNFYTADQLLTGLRSEVEQGWSKAAAPERQKIAAETMELLGWARQILLSRRAHAQGHMARLMRSGAYVSRPATSPLQLELEG